MIILFKHKYLQKFYESASTAGIQNAHKTKLQMILAALDSTQEIDDMDIPGYKLHSLKGKLKGLWLVTVTGNFIRRTITPAFYLFCNKIIAKVNTCVFSHISPLKYQYIPNFGIEAITSQPRMFTGRTKFPLFACPLC